MRWLRSFGSKATSTSCSRDLHIIHRLLSPSPPHTPCLLFLHDPHHVTHTHTFFFLCPPPGDGGVIKTVVCEGQGWQKANPADEAVLTYTARIVDPPAPKQAAAAAADGGSSEGVVPAAVVSSSPEGGAVFTVADAPCSGLAAALKTMKPGEEAHLLIKPDCE